MQKHSWHDHGAAAAGDSRVKQHRCVHGPGFRLCPTDAMHGLVTASLHMLASYTQSCTLMCCWHDTARSQMWRASQACMHACMQAGGRAHCTVSRRASAPGEPRRRQELQRLHPRHAPAPRLDAELEAARLVLICHRPAGTARLREQSSWQWHHLAACRCCACSLLPQSGPRRPHKHSHRDELRQDRIGGLAGACTVPLSTL